MELTYCVALIGWRFTDYPIECRVG